MLQIDIAMPKDCEHCFACELDICNCAITGRDVGDNVLVYHNRPDDCPLKYVSVNE